jgi:hypothetical protein
MLSNKHRCHLCFLIVYLFLCTGFAAAQNDSVNSVKPDTAIRPKSDTVIAPEKSKEKYQRNDAFILYGGINFNKLKVSSGTYESISEPGWHLGVMYKKESFFYWQVGARFDFARYKLRKTNSADTATSAFSVTDLDIPVTVGINLLPITKRVLNVHVFLSAVPTFGLKVGDNTLGIAKDGTNTFRFYGQAGLGVDVFFHVLEAGFNYGFTDLIKDVESKPEQFFVSLGFRF